MSVESETQCTVGRLHSIQGDHITISSIDHREKKQRLLCQNTGNLIVNDIVSVDADGYVHPLWRPLSKDNVIIATDVCNQNCRFCPQPKEGTIYLHSFLNSQLLANLRRNDISLVTITGGEPTLLGDDLAAILNKLLNINPQAEIAILTNGMSFENESYAEKVVESGKKQTRICIPLHSDVPTLHDSITGVQGSFEKTSLGLVNLQRVGADIEIRIVANRLNYRRLSNMASCIGKNFPFVSHVAFMGLELHSKAAEHAREVWIDPPEYMEQLVLATYVLQCRGISVSIYNLPNCLVPESLWPLLSDSISFWKKTFLPSCEACLKKTVCPGLFATSKFQSPSIAPL